jgi:metal-responsive CopG/Arc/MetJ family transcriptional regulator
MERTTIYLPKALHAQLAEAARQRGRPQAQLIREALAAYLVDQKRPRPTTIGMFAVSTVSSDSIEEWLDEHWELD